MKNGASPLTAASFYGYPKICKLLIAMGALVNYQNQKGNAALHNASMKGRSRNLSIAYKERSRHQPKKLG